jgi:hypothetical protein
MVKKLAHDEDVTLFAHAEMLEAIPALIQC